MQITRVLMCELPFNLNLPNGSYHVLVNGAPFELQVINGFVAIHIDQASFAVETPQILRAQIPDYDRFYRQPLRTVIRNELTHDVPDNQLPAVGDVELLEDLHVEMSRPAAFGQMPTIVTPAQTRARLDAMPEEERVQRRLRGAAMRYGRSRMLPSHEEFLVAINSLIRLYMARFGDTFVETIAIDHVAAMSPMHGVMRQIVVGGQLIDLSGIVGAIPPVMRGAWANHPEAQITQFRSDLEAGVLPDSVKLLGVRARAFLNRGANRSAINEASAAMDLSVSRKIRQGYRNKSMTDGDITAILRKRENQNFETRAKELLKYATGQSAAAFDNGRWARIGEHRKTHRQGTSHSDAEPSSADARQVVDDFLWMADKVDAIDPSAQERDRMAVQNRAYEIWERDNRPRGNDWAHWFQAKSDLGIHLDRFV